VKKPRAAIRIRAGKSKAARREAALLRGYLTRLARVRALSDALAATADKAGGATQAKDKVWIGRQYRHGIDLARQLATQLDALAPVARRVAARAARSKAAKALPSTRGFDKVRGRIAAKGFSKRERRLLTRLGFTGADLAMVRAAARNGSLTREQLLRPAAATFTNPAWPGLYTSAARYFRLWAAHPYVATLATLR
jgi:hypothetical protein